MNIYQITLNHNNVYYPNLFQDLITKDPNVNAWWNYLPNVFLVRSEKNAQYFADRIISSYPGVNFLVVKIELDEYNGYLPHAAWDWIKAHSSVKPIRIKSNPLAPTYGDALKRAIEINTQPKRLSDLELAIASLLKNK